MEHDLNRWIFGQSVEGNHKRCLKEFWRLLIWTILRLRVVTTKRWRLCWSQAHLLRWGFGFWGVFLDGSVLLQCEILGKAGLWWFVICNPGPQANKIYSSRTQPSQDAQVLAFRRWEAKRSQHQSLPLEIGQFLEMYKTYYDILWNITYEASLWLWFMIHNNFDI